MSSDNPLFFDKEGNATNEWHSQFSKRLGKNRKDRALLDLPINPDPGFTPGSTPDLGPDSESNPIAVGHTKNDRTS